MIYNVDYVIKNDYSLGKWNEMGAPSKERRRQIYQVSWLRTDIRQRGDNTLLL